MTTNRHAQVRVNSWDRGSLDSLGQRLQPALWLPLLGVISPKGPVAIACSHTNENIGTFRDENAVDH